MNDVWEYKIVDLNARKWSGSGLPDDINGVFDRFGAEGWELVTTEAIIRPTLFGYGTQTHSIVAFFKRPAS